MEHQVILHNDDGDNDNYSGYVEIKLKLDDLKIKWTITDCGCYPSSKWIELLNYMKEQPTDQRSPIISGGGNSSWFTDVNKTNFRLIFDISGNGGDSTIIYKFPIDKMIPVVEQIIEKIKLME